MKHLQIMVGEKAANPTSGTVAPLARSRLSSCCVLMLTLSPFGEFERGYPRKILLEVPHKLHKELILQSQLQDEEQKAKKATRESEWAKPISTQGKT